MQLQVKIVEKNDRKNSLKVEGLALNIYTMFINALGARPNVIKIRLQKITFVKCRRKIVIIGYLSWHDALVLSKKRQ
jgi:hypothetical protein